MGELLEFIGQAALVIALTAWVIRRDLRRLSGEQLDRAWNDATFWSAIVMFSPLCVPIHFARTRRSLAGLALGLGWMLGVVAVSAAVSALLP